MDSGLYTALGTVLARKFCAVIRLQTLVLNSPRMGFGDVIKRIFER